MECISQLLLLMTSRVVVRTIVELLISVPSLLVNKEGETKEEEVEMEALATGIFILKI